MSKNHTHKTDSIGDVITSGSIIIEKSGRLLEKIKYEDDESSEFDAKMRSAEISVAHMDDLSELTDSKNLYSGWHVPCHAILFRCADGRCQIFHVQPNKLSASLLTWKQETQMKQLGKMRVRCIVIKGIRSWYGSVDSRELERAGIEISTVIHLNTNNWWRMLYDIESDEIWVDVKLRRRFGN